MNAYHRMVLYDTSGLHLLILLPTSYELITYIDNAVNVLLVFPLLSPSGLVQFTSSVCLDVTAIPRRPGIPLCSTLQSTHQLTAYLLHVRCTVRCFFRSGRMKIENAGLEKTHQQPDRRCRSTFIRSCGLPRRFPIPRFSSPSFRHLSASQQHQQSAIYDRRDSSSLTRKNRAPSVLPSVCLSHVIEARTLIHSLLVGQRSKGQTLARSRTTVVLLGCAVCHVQRYVPILRFVVTLMLFCSACVTSPSVNITSQNTNQSKSLKYNLILIL